MGLKFMSSMAIPKILWMYWHQGAEAMPPLIQACVRSWRKLNPDWDLRLITGADLSKLAPGLEVLRQRVDIPLQHYSDLLRLELLHAHGGVWADATLLCVKPLSNWLELDVNDPFYAFVSDRRDRWMTNWFLAGSSDSATLCAWRETVLNFWEGHAFPDQAGWRRRLTRRLMSLRKRGLVSNDVWFSHLVADWLKIWPYPINMFLFQQAIEHQPSLRQRWLSTSWCRDTEAERLQNNLGIYAPLSAESKAFLESDATPVHKLNWRIEPEATATNSNFGWLLERLKITQDAAL